MLSLDVHDIESTFFEFVVGVSGFEPPPHPTPTGLIQYLPVGISEFDAQVQYIEAKSI